MASEQIFHYDVFLNHRGPDTKEQFLVPLIEKLREAGIERPFLDRQGIHPGEPVFHVIDEALVSARMHIAVFSRSYAHSKYCLKELQEMLQTGRRIIPVFYDVTPEQVRSPRNPNGPFEEDFRKHLKREKKQVVEGWEAAMEKAAELLGFVRDSDKYRGKDELLMKDIVDDVVNFLRHTKVKIPPRLGRYDWISHYKLPEQGQGVVSFSADCSNDVHVAISPQPQSMNPMYEFVIGGWSNTQSVVRRKSQGPNLCTVPVGLNKPRFDTVDDLWISIDKTTRLLRVGRGKEPSFESVFIIYKDPLFLVDARYVCFTTLDVPATYSNIMVLAME